MSVNDDEVRTANRAVLDEVLRSVAAQDADGVERHLAPDMTMELPYLDGGTLPVPRGEFIENFRMTRQVFSQFPIEVTEVHEGLDPGDFVVEFASDARVRATGAPYRNRFIATFHFRDGKVDRWREYHNPKVAEAALGSTLAGLADDFERETS